MFATMWFLLASVAVMPGFLAVQQFSREISIGGTTYAAECGHERLVLGSCRAKKKCSPSAKYCAIKNVPYATAERFERPRALTEKERAGYRTIKDTSTEGNSAGCVQIDPFTGKVCWKNLGSTKSDLRLWRPHHDDSMSLLFLSLPYYR